MTDDEGMWRRWIQEGFNLGLWLKSAQRIVADFDEKEAAREFFRRNEAICTVIVETRRGAHFHFAGDLPKTYSFEHGEIKATGYIIVPPSVVKGWEYRFVKEGELKPFPEELFPRKETNSAPSIYPGRDQVIKDIRAYIRKIPSISGQHGHNACFRVACVLRDEGFSEIDALTEIEEWNHECASPPWSVRELSKKVKDAFRVKGE